MPVKEIFNLAKLRIFTSVNDVECPYLGIETGACHLPQSAAELNLSNPVRGGVTTPSALALSAPRKALKSCHQLTPILVKVWVKNPTALNFLGQKLLECQLKTTLISNLIRTALKADIHPREIIHVSRADCTS